MLVALILTGLILSGLGAATGHLSGRTERESPPSGRIIDAGGIRQHVIERGPPDGEAPVLVMIHGAYGSAEEFAISLMPQTSRHFRSVAVDRPGHGYSTRGDDAPVTPDKQARYLEAALRELNVEKPVILLGFSYGGAVALSYALQFPDRVASMVLISPATHRYEKSALSLSDLTSAPLIGPLLRHTVVTPVGHLLIDDGVERVFAPGPVPPAYERVPVELSVRPHSYAANTEDVDVLSDYLGQQALQYPSLNMPIFVVANDDDRIVSPALHSRKLAKDAPLVEMILVEGGGHPLHFSRTEVVLDAIGRAAASRSGADDLQRVVGPHRRQ